MKDVQVHTCNDRNISAVMPVPGVQAGTGSPSACPPSSGVQAVLFWGTGRGFSGVQANDIGLYKGLAV